MSRAVLTPKDVAARRTRRKSLNDEQAQFVRGFASHMQARGRSAANDARFRAPDAAGSIYVVGFDNYVKIGFSMRPEQRIAALQIALPVPLVVYAVFDGTQVAEKKIHARYAEYKLRGEWFMLKGKVRAFVKRRASQ